MTWIDLAKEECRKATERVKESEVLLGLAYEAHRRDPNRDNEIALAAATRLVKEVRAQEAEWTL